MEREPAIRRAGIDDIGRIGNLARMIWPQAYKEILSESQLEYMLHLFYSPDSLRDQMNKHTFLLAVIDEEPVGFASYSITETPGVYKLHKLYVLPETQGAGLGRTLMQSILSDLRVLNATALDLNVNRENRARFFYEKLGFKIIRTEDIDIGNNYWMNDFVMRLEVPV